MSATSTVPLCAGPSPWSSPGLSAANVTVRSARTASPGASPVSASTPEGMSMARTRRARAAPRARRSGPEAGAVGAVDHQVARRQRHPSPGRFGLEHLHPGPAPRQDVSRDPSVGAVAALARDHDDPAPVGAPEHPQGSQGHRRAGALDQGLVGDLFAPRPRRRPASRRGSGRRACSRLRRPSRRGGGGSSVRTPARSLRRPALLGHHEGDGHVVGVRQRQVEPAGAVACRPARPPSRAAPGRVRCGWRPSRRSAAPRRRSARRRRCRCRAPSSRPPWRRSAPPGSAPGRPNRWRRTARPR